MGLKNRLAKLRSGARNLWKDTGGQSLMIFGLMAVPLCGAVGIGLDVAQWTVWKRQLHSAADAAALAGATARAEGKNVDQAVKRSLALNNLRTFTTKAIENAPTTGSYKGDTTAVRVVLETSQQLGFSGMFLKKTPALQAEATAIAANEVANCVITLDTSGTGLTISGSATVDMDCGMSSNSNADITSSDPVSAGAISAVGNINTGGGLSTDTKLNPGIQPVADPMASKVPDLSTALPCTSNYWPLVKSNWTASPGCYNGIQISGGIVTLAPGVYYIGEKGIKIAAGATLQGTGVTLVFTSFSSPFNDTKVGSFDANGGATIKLSAPTSGTWAGILMYQDRRAAYKSTQSMNVTGNTLSAYQGVIYAPSNEVKFTGNSSMSTPCMQIVAKYASFEGNTSVSNSCPAGSGASSFGGNVLLRLVA